MEDKQLTKEEREKLHEQEIQSKIKSQNTKKTVKKIVIYSIIVLIIAAIIYFPISNAKKPGKYDDFAKCLTEKKAAFYGSFQCPACAKQKQLFGKSMNYVNYVECGPIGQQSQACKDASIKAYPTWIFNNNLTREGILSLEELSQVTGCIIKP